MQAFHAAGVPGACAWAPQFWWGDSLEWAHYFLCFCKKLIVF